MSDKLTIVAIHSRNECDSSLTLYEIPEVAEGGVDGSLASVGAGDGDVAEVPGNGGGSITGSLFGGGAPFTTASEWERKS